MREKDGPITSRKGIGSPSVLPADCQVLYIFGSRMGATPSSGLQLRKRDVLGAHRKCLVCMLTRHLLCAHKRPRSLVLHTRVACVDTRAGLHSGCRFGVAKFGRFGSVGVPGWANLDSVGSASQISVRLGSVGSVRSARSVRFVHIRRIAWGKKHQLPLKKLSKKPSRQTQLREKLFDVSSKGAL